MRIEGRWLRGADGIERPVLDGYLATPERRTLYIPIRIRSLARGC